MKAFEWSALVALLPAATFVTLAVQNLIEPAAVVAAITVLIAAMTVALVVTTHFTRAATDKCTEGSSLPLVSPASPLGGQSRQPEGGAGPRAPGCISKSVAPVAG